MDSIFTLDSSNQEDLTLPVTLLSDPNANTSHLECLKSARFGKEGTYLYIRPR